MSEITNEAIKPLSDLFKVFNIPHAYFYFWLKFEFLSSLNLIRYPRFIVNDNPVNKPQKKSIIVPAPANLSNKIAIVKENMPIVSITSLFLLNNILL